MPFKTEDTFYGDGSQRMYGLVMMIGQLEKAPTNRFLLESPTRETVRYRLPKEGLSSQTVRVMLHTALSASRPAQGRQLSNGSSRYNRPFGGNGNVVYSVPNTHYSVKTDLGSDCRSLSQPT